MASDNRLTMRGILRRIWPGPAVALPVEAVPVVEEPQPEPMSLALALALDRLRRGGALGSEDQAQLLTAAAEIGARQAVDLTAADLMTADLITLSPEADWRAMSALFFQHGVKTLPVVDAQGQFMGLIPLHILLRPGAQGLTARHLVQEAVSQPPEASFAEVLAPLMEGGQSVLPVVAEDGRLVGLITRTDIMAGLILAMVHS